MNAKPILHTPVNEIVPAPYEAERPQKGARPGPTPLPPAHKEIHAPLTEREEG